MHAYGKNLQNLKLIRLLQSTVRRFVCVCVQIFVTIVIIKFITSKQFKITTILNSLNLHIYNQFRKVKPVFLGYETVDA